MEANNLSKYDFIKRLDDYLHSDFLGAAASLLCIIHCALTPLLFLTKPILDSTVHSHGGHSLWGMLDWVFLILSLGAVWYSAKHTLHRNLGILLWIFWVIFAIGLLLEMNDFTEAKWLMYVGSLSLAATHIINYRHCKKWDD